MNTKKDGRKRGLRWDPAVIEQLVRLNILDFLPEESIKVRLQAHIASPILDPKTVKKLETLLSRYSGRRLAMGHLRADLQEAIRALGEKDTLQIFPIAEAMMYVQGRVGLPVWPHLLPHAEPHPGQKSRDHHQGQSQRDVFLRSMGLDEGTWGEIVWKESMLLRFDPRGKTLLDWIEEPVRTRLNAEAASFGDGEFDEARAYELLRSIPEWKLFGPVMTAIAIKYLRARSCDDQGFVDVLTLPICESPIFSMIADGKLGGERECHPLRLRCSLEKYRRFLSPDPIESLQLQGQILYYLIRLDTWFTDHNGTTIPKDLENLWPKPFSPLHVRRTPEYRLIKEKFMEELKLNKNFFSKIWRAFVNIQMKDLRRRRAPAGEIVFWTARILQSIRPDVYDACRAQVDQFHAVMHDTNGLVAHDGAQLSDIVGVFSAALMSDPLLYAVFHTEVLNGQKRLSYRPGRGGTDDHLLNLTLVHAYALLKSCWPSKNVRGVDLVLSEIPRLPSWILDSVSTQYFSTDERSEAGAKSMFAYLTVLVISMFGSNDWDLRPHSTKARCMDHHSCLDLDILLANLPD